MGQLNMSAEMMHQAFCRVAPVLRGCLFADSILHNVVRGLLPGSLQAVHGRIFILNRCFLFASFVHVSCAAVHSRGSGRAQDQRVGRQHAKGLAQVQVSHCHQLASALALGLGLWGLVLP